MKYIAILLLITSFLLAEEKVNDSEQKIKLLETSLKSDSKDWIQLSEKDFSKVNSADDTWSFKDNIIYCTGKPKSVIRTKKKYTNFEILCEWKHKKLAGNSGIFIWTTDESIDRLTKAGKPGLPKGIEIQVLDTGYTEYYKKRYNKPADWFTCHGDVFAVGAKMKPFPPVGPKGSRSFPTENRSKDVNQWNHYYVKAIDGEVRLWVNGVEVAIDVSGTAPTGLLDCNFDDGSGASDFYGKVRDLRVYTEALTDAELTTLTT